MLFNVINCKIHKIYSTLYVLLILYANAFNVQCNYSLRLRNAMRINALIIIIIYEHKHARGYFLLRNLAI